jgi:long-chain fatty acid transport protein
MKRIPVALCLLAFFLFGASPVFAGGIENKPNFSAEWIRTLNRNAAFDSADCAVYNPAGTSRMPEGFYVNLAGQYAIKEYSNSFGGTTYESDTPDMVPGLFALYRKDRWSLFGAFTIPVGGGKVEFEQGSVTSLMLARGFQAGANAAIDANPAIPGPAPKTAFYYDSINHYIEGESYYYGITLGGSYALNDMVSVSMGARYADAQISRKGHARVSGSPVATAQTAFLDYEETDSGVCGIVGLNIAATDRLNLGFRYESKTRIDLKTDVKKDDLGLLVNGATRKRDIPALFAAGLSYQLTPRLRAETGLTYYFNKQADWDDNPITTQNETDRGNGYDLGIAFEYECTPRFKWSVGYMYTETKIHPDNMSIEAPELDGHSVGGGVAWSPADRWSLNAGLMKTFYQDETTTNGIKLEKSLWIMALGIQYKFF